MTSEKRIKNKNDTDEALESLESYLHFEYELIPPKMEIDEDLEPEKIKPFVFNLPLFFKDIRTYFQLACGDQQDLETQVTGLLDKYVPLIMSRLMHHKVVAASRLYKGWLEFLRDDMKFDAAQLAKTVEVHGAKFVQELCAEGESNWACIGLQESLDVFMTYENPDKKAKKTIKGFVLANAIDAFSTCVLHSVNGLVEENPLIDRDSREKKSISYARVAVEVYKVCQNALKTVATFEEIHDFTMDCHEKLSPAIKIAQHPVVKIDDEDREVGRRPYDTENAANFFQHTLDALYTVMPKESFKDGFNSLVPDFMDYLIACNDAGSVTRVYKHLSDLMISDLVFREDIAQSYGVRFFSRILEKREFAKAGELFQIIKDDLLLPSSQSLVLLKPEGEENIPLAVLVNDNLPAGDIGASAESDYMIPVAVPERFVVKQQNGEKSFVFNEVDDFTFILKLEEARQQAAKLCHAFYNGGGKAHGKYLRSFPAA